MPESTRWLISKERYEEAHQLILEAAKENKKDVPEHLIAYAAKMDSNHVTPMLWMTEILNIFKLITGHNNWITSFKITKREGDWYVSLFGACEAIGNYAAIMVILSANSSSNGPSF